MDSPPTHRQLEILALVAAGDTREEIARQLFISPMTVRRHLEDLRARVGARTTSHAISLCIARGHLGVDGRSEVVYVPEPFVLAA